jgi:uncharacterized membrane-anchored protein YitT (DUF2179 family)
VRTAFIVTDDPDRVAEAVMNQLGIGVTAWGAEGKFTQTAHTVLFCTVSRPDVDTLRAAVGRADPAAFLVIGHGHQATGGVLRAGSAGPRVAAAAAEPAAPKIRRKVRRPASARARRTR